MRTDSSNNPDSGPEPAVAGTTTLGNEALTAVCELIAARTRFGASDVSHETTEIVHQPFAIHVEFYLKPELRTLQITGQHLHGADKSDDSKDPAQSARATTEARIKIALGSLRALVERPGALYDQVPTPTLLAAERQFWHLHECSYCSGRGRKTCIGCDGVGKLQCTGCSGSGKCRCSYCLSGKMNCTQCGGSGGRYVNVPYQVRRETWVNGYCQIHYSTEYRTERVTCTSCFGGRVTCTTCFGSARVTCSGCYGAGKITCNSCSGIGTTSCGVCAGTSYSGNAAQLDVDVLVEPKIVWPETAQPEVTSIGEEGHTTLAKVSSRLSFVDSALDASDPKKLAARYIGDVLIDRTKVVCAGKSYLLVSYGTQRDWLDLNHIIEDLLVVDLDHLKAAIGVATQDGFLSTEFASLLKPLRFVVESKLNVDLVTAALGKGINLVPVSGVSAEYADEVKKSVPAALKLAYVRLAKRGWLQKALSAMVVTLAGWVIAGSWLGVPLGLIWTPLLIPLLKWRMLVQMRRAGFGREQAQSAAEIATQVARKEFVRAVLMAPAVLTVVALAVLLPGRPGWTFLPNAMVPPALIEARTAPQLSSALFTYAQGNYAQARAQIETLAHAGNRLAAGPYGWMMLLGEGLPAGQAIDQSSRIKNARPWIDEGLMLGDPWAKAAQGVSLVDGLGMPVDLQGGLRLLHAAAQQNHTGAMNYLGLISAMGDGVPKSMVGAEVWFGRAADLGRPESLYNIGLMYWRGEGPLRANRGRAMQLWQQAAAKGEERAIQAVAKKGPPN